MGASTNIHSIPNFVVLIDPATLSLPDEFLAQFGFQNSHLIRGRKNAFLDSGSLGTAVWRRLEADLGRVGVSLAPGECACHVLLRDAPPTPVQLGKVEPAARKLFPLDKRVEDQPWLGRRPCLPDMLPAIGPIPGIRGLWANFGHHHLGFTLGPVTGRLVAEMMTGATPFTDATPYRPDRFA